MSDVDVYADLAQRLADAVRPVVLPRFRSGVAYDVKADASPVTVADREAEAVMRRMIGQSAPDHGILGEEHGGERLGASYVWVLDPIDGTKSFVTGKPLFGTLIALLRDGVPIIGVIDMPALGERWVGITGRPTTFNGQPVRTRRCDRLDRAWLYATSPQMFKGEDAVTFERLRERCYAAVWGADCYAYGLLASGFVDLVCEASLQPYDYCAVMPVITGAGGMLTDWQGVAPGLRGDGRVIAAGNAALHATALAALKGE
ncbi:MAG: histidinol-phosphatase [Rhodospirillales bacterium]|nr:histidinol-phosphatase [Rhodospirillales bacterium]